MTDTPKPPAHLSKSSAAYFKTFVYEYEVEDFAHRGSYPSLREHGEGR
jgi:hypothetical protein